MLSQYDGAVAEKKEGVIQKKKKFLKNGTKNDIYEKSQSNRFTSYDIGSPFDGRRVSISTMKIV
jgi:hypothetical protein